MPNSKNSPFATIPYVLDGVVGFTKRYKLPMDAKIITAKEAMQRISENNDG